MDVHPLILLAAFLFGSCIGSFLNVSIWRWPRDQELTGRSQCPHCRHQLSGRDLIPVVSYVLFGGQCRYCRGAISWRYPVIEVVTGALFVAAVLLVNPAIGNSLAEWLLVARYGFIFSVLLAVFIIDYEHYLILDRIIFPAVIVVILVDLLSLAVFGAGADYRLYAYHIFLGMAAGFIPFYLLWKASRGRWMGLGDAKLGLFLGVVMGFPQVWAGYFLAFLVGSAVSVPLLATGKKGLASQLPFGTFLTVSALLTIWFGPALTRWYAGLIGLS